MKEQIQQWQQKWRTLSPSDQRALSILGFFAGTLFIVFGLFAPAKGFFDEARVRAQESRELIRWMQSQRPVLERIKPAGTGTRASGTLLQRVTGAAKQHQVTIKRFEPEGDNRIRLWIEEARYQDLQPWINQLIQAQLTVRTINMDALPEQGMVSARLTVEG
ncbi:type II secretion system protein M [Microbulbifer sp. 2205BS26-8]|uniref:type II secretion system protein M n=1 Tax=Microbulbifer sp. 2205BS26-8 TaxID=3064386 RepID=UPI00273EAD1B|nr:type II secretion system protein M [Microbulbifer sp. 2205BS26-8]MDP5209071.1 type II secretion system protein M [Microbulbifer sp. 2205BS26-8]